MCPRCQDYSASSLPSSTALPRLMTSGSAASSPAAAASRGLRLLDFLGVSLDRHDHLVGIVEQLDALRQRQLGGRDVLAELEVGDIDAERLRDRLGRALDVQRAADPVEEAADLDAHGLAFEHDRDLDLEPLALDDADEVEVDVLPGEGVDLGIAHHRVALLLGALHLEQEHRVAPLLLAQQLGDGVAVEHDRNRLLVLAAVHDRGNQPLRRSLRFAPLPVELRRSTSITSSSMTPTSDLAAKPQGASTLPQRTSTVDSRSPPPAFPGPTTCGRSAVAGFPPTPGPRIEGG